MPYPVECFRNIAKHSAKLQAFLKSLANIVVYVCYLINVGVTFDETGLIRREEVVGNNIVVQVFMNTRLH
jgi:hypothetical protein